MGVFSSVLGFFGISAALRTSPVPIAGIKEKLFKPGESKDFDDLLKIAISLGVTVSVDSAALEREGFDGKYEPERNNIVLPAIPDRSKPEFYGRGRGVKAQRPRCARA
jgi:hypothetical protein